MADRISIRVKPGSKKGPLIETAADGELTIYVRAQSCGARIRCDVAHQAVSYHSMSANVRNVYGFDGVSLRRHARSPTVG